jgi:hypothetical protein
VPGDSLASAAGPVTLADSVAPAGRRPAAVSLTAAGAEVTARALAAACALAVVRTSVVLPELPDEPQAAVRVASATAPATKVTAGMPRCPVSLAENMRPPSVKLLTVT